MQWEAQYKDGTSLPQYNADGTENRYADIDRSRLEAFSLVRADGSIALHLVLDPGQRLIYRLRVEQSTGPASSKIVVYMAGWQQTINGQNIQSIAYVREDGGTVLMAGRFRDDDPWLYSIQPVPCEEPEVDGNHLQNQ